MRLIWKVLRQHLSVGQLFGFVLANIIGLAIIVLGFQLYLDIRPVMTNKGGFMRPDFMVISKPVSAVNAVSGIKPTFDAAEIKEIESQPFVAQVGTFTPAKYRIWGEVIIKSHGIDVGTDLFFEAVPNDFIDVESQEWSFQPGDQLVPIILPRTYLNLYNFGYAPTSSFPAISESMISKVVLHLTLWGNGNSAKMHGKIIGFSSRLNTILVPQTFIDWSNAQFAEPEAETLGASRLIIRVTNPTDKRIAAYFKEHDLNVEGDNLNASKAAWLMRLLVAVVMLIGLIICLLAGYVLMLSIFLLLQRNHEAIRNLKAIGYTAKKLALPYQLLVFGTNLLSVCTAMVILAVVRYFYLRYLTVLMPNMQPLSLVWAWMLVLVFALLMTVINARLVHNSVKKTC